MDDRMKIKPEDSIGYADYLRIIFSNKCIVKMLEQEEIINFTFHDVMNVAQQNGYKDGMLLLMAEAPINGKIYAYGNYGHFWVEHGSTNGYA